MPAESITIENFANQPETRWRFITDQVMGGISSGNIAFLREDGRPHVRMTGVVSTANRGGFIQMRHELVVAPPQDVVGVRLLVRGNDQRYFVHLRTAETNVPWYFYQAGFDVTRDWTEVKLPLTAFAASRRMPQSVAPMGQVKSIAIVAYGRDHGAEIDVREVGFY